MANVNNKSNVNQIFNDLDLYRNFCSEYGYKFDERDLYESQSYVWRQFQKSLAGKSVKDQWEVDRIRFKEQAAQKEQRKSSVLTRFSKPTFRKRVEGAKYEGKDK
jgi:hypothetical protein